MDKVQLILSSVALPDLCTKLGLPRVRIGLNHSPLRKDSRPSFSVRVNGCWKWRDFGRDIAGDVIDFYAEATGSTKPIQDLYDFWFCNGDRPKPMRLPPETPTLPAVPLDWDERVSKLSDEMLAFLSDWRGYPLEFCHWLRDRKIIGSYADTFCFPVYNQGHVVRFHVRWPSGAWQYKPAKVASHLTPLMIGPAKPSRVFVAESQWDLFAAMCVLPLDYVNDCRWIATRGVSNGGGVADYVLRQRDDTEDKREKERAWSERWPGAWSIWPKIGKDCNEWLQEDFEGMQMDLAITLGEV